MNGIIPSNLSTFPTRGVGGTQTELMADGSLFRYIASKGIIELHLKNSMRLVCMPINAITQIALFLALSP